MRDLVIKNAKQGEESCSENFNSSINEIKDEIFDQLKLIFPDFLIEFGVDEDSNYHTKRIYIMINWTQ
jgi:phosphoribosylaminoimidazole-succinocarboxamide synthase